MEEKHPPTYPPDDPADQPTEEMDTLVMPPAGQTEPPTEELPTIEGHATNPNVISVRPGEDPFSRLEEAAEEWGQNDMLGVMWRDERGLVNRVSGYELVHRTRDEKVVRKTLINRRPVNTGALRISREPTLKGTTLINRAPRYRQVDETLEYRTVDVLNAEGDIIAVNEFMGRDEFRASFYKDSKSHFSLGNEQIPRNITGFVWPPGVVDAAERTADDPNSLRRIDVPTNGSHTAFPKLISEKERRGLESLQGATWTDENGDERKIIRDENIITTDGLTTDEYPEKIVEVQTRGEDGETKHRGVCTLNELHQEFSSRDSLYPNAPPLDLHFEIPRLTAREQQARLGRMVTGETTTDTGITLDEAYKRLSYPELPIDNEDRATIIYNLRHNPTTRKYAYELQETVEEVGSHRFNEIVDNLHDEFRTDMRLMGLSLTPQDTSKSWLIMDLIKQRYYGRRIKSATTADALKKLEKEARDDGYSGYAGDPFEDSLAGRQRQGLPLATRLAQRFKQAGIKARPVQVPDPATGRPRTVLHYQENPEYSYTDKIRALLDRQDIDKIMKKEITILMKGQDTGDDEALTEDELDKLTEAQRTLRIGESIRRSFGRI